MFTLFIIRNASHMVASCEDSVEYIIINEVVKTEWLSIYKMMLENAIENCASMTYIVSVFNVQNVYTKKAKTYQKAAHRASFWELLRNAELLKHYIH